MFRFLVVAALVGGGIAVVRKWHRDVQEAREREVYQEQLERERQRRAACQGACAL